jgi:predicted nucleic acid-binding protein
MVLVDTSVWIRAFAGLAPYKGGLDRLLSRGEVVGHEMLYGELLIGDKAGRRKFLSEYEQFQQAEIIPHNELVALVRGRGLYGRGVGWIDVHILASALVGRFRVWTADPRFAAVALELGVGYEPAKP